MSSLRLDKVHLSSFHEAFRNRERFYGSISMSGSLGAGNSVNFDLNISVQRNGAISEVYYERSGGFPKRRSDSGLNLYDYSGSGNATISVTATSPTNIRVRISVFNPTGSSITIPSRTYNITAYIFDTPFSD